ncbi:MAG: hypothetical protein SVP52_08695 [Chloroflexota bacterium]|nr:hypothetical protein [Chloroflexota bacterium]
MKIKQISLKDRQAIKQFIDLPFTLYQNTEQWVPPLRSEIRKIFDPSFPFYNYGDAAFGLAQDQNGENLGRLVVANNHPYNDFHESKTAFFYYFECVDDPAVAEGLFSWGFDWVESQGLNHILGPKGLMVLDGFGMLVDGFEYQPAFGQPYNPKYYPTLIEALGFKKVKDVLTGRIDRNSHFPEKVRRSAKLVKERLGFWSPRLKTKKELKKVIEDLKALYNTSLAGPAGNPPITDSDLDAMVSQLMWIADPKLVKLLYKGDQPVGWMLGYPDISDALKKANGRLFPTGWAGILLESKRTNRIILNGIGIIEDYQRLGGTAILLNEIYNSVMEDEQYDRAEILQLREENINILLEVSSFDIDFHKTHRLYEKYL